MSNHTRQFIILGFHNKVGAHPMGVGRVHYYYVGQGSDRDPTLSSEVGDAAQFDWDTAVQTTRQLNEHADGYMFWPWRAP
jgi:hypothetical protein